MNVCGSSFVERDKIADWVDFALWQYTFPHINFSKGTIGQKVNASCETFTVLIWSGHIWIFHVPKIENHLGKIVYWITWRHLISCDDSTKRTFDKWSSPEFPVMAEMLECMYKARRWLPCVFTESVWLGFCQTSCYVTCNSSDVQCTSVR